MSQSISLLGAQYNNVPAVELPKTGGGSARFDDCTVVTAVASDVASGKVFVASDGTITTGTSSGGGGSSSYTLLGSTELTINTTSTTATDQYTFSFPANTFSKSKIIYVRIRDKAGARNGYFYCYDAWFSFYTDNMSNESTAARIFRKINSNGTVTSASTSYGVYPYDITASTSSENTLKIRSRYSSSSTGTINGTYKVEVYSLAFPDNISPF